MYRDKQNVQFVALILPEAGTAYPGLGIMLYLQLQQLSCQVQFDTWQAPTSVVKDEFLCLVEMGYLQKISVIEWTDLLMHNLAHPVRHLRLCP
jgi:hypothetical protein